MSTSRVDNSGSFHTAGTQLVSSSIITNGGHVHFHAATAVGDTQGASNVRSHVHWLVPRSANPLFTGREALLQDLEKTIRNRMNSTERYSPCQIVISAMGGQGKSELCLQLARRLRSLFWAVLWVDVSTRDNAERSFMEAARKLSIPVRQWEDARHGIANLVHPWLLVLDNADDPEIDYQEYFPESGLGTVTMTTRNEECWQYGTDQTISLTGLEISEARDLLLKATRIPPDLRSTYDQDAMAVANLLQSHPLALTQAGAYVSRGHCTLAEYPRLYVLQRQRLLSFRPTQARSRYGDVYATFEVSAAMLAAMGTQSARDALDLLPLLAVCEPNHLPVFIFEEAWRGAKQISPDLDDQAEDPHVELLTPWHLKHLPVFMTLAGDCWDASRLIEALALLKTLSLVSSTSPNDIALVSVHPLVHAWARDRQDEGRQQYAWLQMGCVVALALGVGTLFQKDQRLLQSHVEALVNWDMAKMFARQLLVQVARILYHCGVSLRTCRADSKLRTLLDRLFDYLNLDRIMVDRSWIGLYVLTARNLHTLGRSKEAVQLFEQVHKIHEETLSADHPDRLNSQQELAQMYRANGQVTEAIMLLEQVVKISDNIPVENYPGRLASQHELALAYKAKGRITEAIVILEKVVEDNTRIWAVDDLGRLASQFDLALTYKANGQINQATALIRQVVEIGERSQPADDPDRLASEWMLANMLWYNREYSEALEMLRQVVERMRYKFDGQHPQRIDAEFDLALMEENIAPGE